MTSIQNRTNTTNTTSTTNTTATGTLAGGAGNLGDADGDIEPMSSPAAPAAARFERPALSGDSRVVSPAGGGTGEVNAQEAIDAHSKRAGTFTEARTVNGKQLFFTPAGARAVDAWQRRAQDNSAPLRAERDPSFWQRFLSGDPFAGREQHTGKAK